MFKKYEKRIEFKEKCKKAFTTYKLITVIQWKINGTILRKF